MEEGWGEVGGHVRIVVRDEGSGFGEGRGLGGGLVVGGGGLEGDGGLYLPLMAVGTKGGGGSRSVEGEEGVEEQGELGLAVHGGVVGVVGISHPVLYCTVSIYSSDYRI